MTSQYNLMLQQLPVSERVQVRNWIERTLFLHEDYTAYTTAYYSKLDLPHTWGAARCRVFWDDHAYTLRTYSLVIKAYLDILPIEEQAHKDEEARKHAEFKAWDESFVFEYVVPAELPF